MATNVAAQKTAGTPKNIIVFLDGTWNDVDGKADSDGRHIVTNVARLLEAVEGFDAEGRAQIVHYIPGVGTHKGEQLLGGVFGYGIGRNIKEAYLFIAGNYLPGDQIYIFGFSRGAYTARSLAGMIHNIGILQRRYFYRVDDAYDHYRDRSGPWHPDGEKAIAFRNAFTFGDGHKSIRFVGVWDTVAALGAPYGVLFGGLVDRLFNRRFHDTKLSNSIEKACHAVSIDEPRWPFRPTLWDRSYNRERLEERWFPGVHADIGGGVVRTGLSDISLNWMMQQASTVGLALNLRNITSPEFRMDSSESIESPPYLLVYRIATLVFVKLPSLIGINWLRSDEKPLVNHIRINGDFVRPIPDLAGVSDEAHFKKQHDQGYQPLNF